MAKKILIIEDDRAVSKALKIKLTHEKFDVVIAKNGRQGLEIALKEQPDVILLDIIMPVMDGLTMLAKLREDTWGKSVPVILLTNLSDSQQISEAFEQGVHDYLVKSAWKLEDVVAKIRERTGE